MCMHMTCNCEFDKPSFISSDTLRNSYRQCIGPTWKDTWFAIAYDNIKPLLTIHLVPACPNFENLMLRVLLDYDGVPDGRLRFRGTQ